MAQIVRYFGNNEPDTYCEGPFVLTAMPNSHDYRIECEMKGVGMPVMADSSVIDYVAKLWGNSMRWYNPKAADICDNLNSLVKAGKIVLNPKGYWEVVNA